MEEQLRELFALALTEFLAEEADSIDSDCSEQMLCGRLAMILQRRASASSSTSSFSIASLSLLSERNRRLPSTTTYLTEHPRHERHRRGDRLSMPRRDVDDQPPDISPGAQFEVIGDGFQVPADLDLVRRRHLTECAVEERAQVLPARHAEGGMEVIHCRLQRRLRCPTGDQSRPATQRRCPHRVRRRSALDRAGRSHARSP